MNDLKAFLDGELDAAAATTMQTRLQSDAQLARVAESFRRMSASFGALSDGPASTGREKVLIAIATPKPWEFPWRTAGAIASAFLLTMIVVEIFPIFAQSRVASPETAMVEGMKARSKDSSVAAGAEAESPAASLPNQEDFPERPAEPLAGTEAYAPPLTTLPSPSKSGATVTDLFERKVVKTASLDVRVKSIDQAEAKVTSYVDGVRGYVENSTSSNLDGKSPSMTLTVRVPQQKFSEAMATFEKLGERTAKDIQSSDVTQAIVDMDARLKNLRSQEETYRAILRSARKIGEIIDVQERLSVIRGEIESMQAQRDSMSKLAALSTITVTLSQRPPPEEAVSGGWVEDTWSSATHALGGALKSLSVMGIWILVYAPLWVPLSIVALWGWRRALRA